MIERIVLTAVADARGFEIDLIDEMAATVRLGLPDERSVARPVSTADHALFARSVKVVAGTHNQFYLLYIVQGLRPKQTPVFGIRCDGR